MSGTSVSLGDDAPLFCLPNQDGIEICLQNLMGKWVILYFYPKDNTSGCTKEAKEFTFLKNYFEEEGAVILGVSKDSTESHKKFIEKEELKITLLSDVDISVHKLYNVWRLKKFMGKESMGTVRTTFLIDPQGRITYIWDNVKAKGHAHEVLDKFRSLKKEIIK
ncbi:MAG: peroxiredoxin [Methanomethylovorans sp.]|nr:peroxiredoxin [Methanomethylovorans sp.]